MTQTGYSNAIVNALLGWLKGLASWVLKLFDLAGSGGSPLLWLSEHWLQLLIVLLILGVALDWIIWMIRWRPYWVWFRKKRIIVNDERFLNEGDLREAERGDPDEPMEREYVVPSTVVKRRRSPQRRPAAAQATVERCVRRRTSPPTTCSKSVTARKAIPTFARTRSSTSPTSPRRSRPATTASGTGERAILPDSARRSLPEASISIERKALRPGWNGEVDKAGRLPVRLFPQAKEACLRG